MTAVAYTHPSVADGLLHIGELPVGLLVERADASALQEDFHPSYAVKADPVPAVVQHSSRPADGLDDASAGEMVVPLDRPIPTDRVSLATRAELGHAVAARATIGPDLPARSATIPTSRSRSRACASGAARRSSVSTLSRAPFSAPAGRQWTSTWSACMCTPARQTCTPISLPGPTARARRGLANPYFEREPESSTTWSRAATPSSSSMAASPTSSLRRRASRRSSARTTRTGCRERRPCAGPSGRRNGLAASPTAFLGHPRPVVLVPVDRGRRGLHDR
jgi:hypothetical protein